MVDTDPEAFVWRNDPTLSPLGIVYEDGVHKFATAMKWVGDIEKVFGIVCKTQEHFMEMPSALIWKFEGMDCLGMCDYVYAPHMTVRTSTSGRRLHGDTRLQGLYPRDAVCW